MFDNSISKNGVVVVNCDCLELMSQLEDESVDLIVTDPPYTTTPRGNAGNSGGMLQKKINKDGKVFSFNSITPPNTQASFIVCLKMAVTVM